MHADATLTGSGAGSLLTFSGDVGSSSPVMMTLTGMPDGVPPVLTSSALTGVVDPFDSFELLSSEPLPPDVRPELVDGAGTRTPLIPDGASAAAASFQFAGPAVFLPYATSYLIALDGVHDFAGSAAQGGPLSLMTMPAPPLLAEDGFESTPPPVVTGGQVVTADTVPPIAGSQSLYVAPGTNLAPLQLRLAISPGDTVLRFSYRVVKLASLSIAASYELGVPGAPIGSLLVDETIAAGAGTTTTIAGVGTVTLGPIQTAAATLPVGSTGELTLRRSGTVTTCNSLPQPPTNGIIIDDLRTE